MDMSKLRNTDLAAEIGSQKEIILSLTQKKERIQMSLEQAEYRLNCAIAELLRRANAQEKRD